MNKLTELTTAEQNDYISNVFPILAAHLLPDGQTWDDYKIKYVYVNPEEPFHIQHQFHAVQDPDDHESWICVDHEIELATREHIIYIYRWG